jgi:DNA-binding transcriptional MocR family regulator
MSRKLCRGFIVGPRSKLGHHGASADALPIALAKVKLQIQQLEARGLVILRRLRDLRKQNKCKTIISLTCSGQ